MVAPETWILTWALATSMLAAVVPWLQRRDEIHVGWERKTLFGILVGDACFHWVALAAVGEAHPGSSWIGSLTVLTVGGLALGAYFLVRGYELPPPLRWGGVAALLVIEPVMLALTYAATR